MLTDIIFIAHTYIHTQNTHTQYTHTTYFLYVYIIISKQDFLLKCHILPHLVCLESQQNSLLRGYRHEVHLRLSGEKKKKVVLQVQRLAPASVLFIFSLIYQFRKISTHQSHFTKSIYIFQMPQFHEIICLEVCLTCKLLPKSKGNNVLQATHPCFALSLWVCQL